MEFFFLSNLNLPALYPSTKEITKFLKRTGLFQTLWHREHFVHRHPMFAHVKLKCSWLMSIKPISDLAQTGNSVWTQVTPYFKTSSGVCQPSHEQRNLLLQDLNQATHLAFRRASAASSTALLRSLSASSSVRHCEDFFPPASWEAQIPHQSHCNHWTTELPQSGSLQRFTCRWTFPSNWAPFLCFSTAQLEALQVMFLFQCFVLVDS